MIKTPLWPKDEATELKEIEVPILETWRERESGQLGHIIAIDVCTDFVCLAIDQHPIFIRNLTLLAHWEKVK